MKKTNSILMKFMKNTVDESLKIDANSTSCTIIYQPKAPSKLKQFSKFKD